MSQVLYYNNRGSRWNTFPKEKIYAVIDGVLIQRTPIFFESFGNFASVTIKYKGKRVSTLNYSYDKIALRYEKEEK